MRLGLVSLLLRLSSVAAAKMRNDLQRQYSEVDDCRITKTKSYSNKPETRKSELVLLSVLRENRSELQCWIHRRNELLFTRDHGPVTVHLLRASLINVKENNVSKIKLLSLPIEHRGYGLRLRQKLFLLYFALPAIYVAWQCFQLHLSVCLSAGPDYPMSRVCTCTRGSTTLEAPPPGKCENCRANG